MDDVEDEGSESLLTFCLAGRCTPRAVIIYRKSVHGKYHGTRNAGAKTERGGKPFIPVFAGTGR